MKIKEVTITNLGDANSLYGNNHNIGWHPVKKSSISGTIGLIGHTTWCKEDIGAQCVRHGLNRFIIIIPEVMDDESITELASYLEEKECEVSIKRTVINRVVGRPKWLLITHSPRWSRNSVAHSVLTTWLRVAIANYFHFQMSDVIKKDADHLKECGWLLNLLTKHKMRIFGTQQHEYYDFGMVSFTARLRTGNFWDGNAEEPDRYDYDTEDDYDYAYNDWDYIQSNNTGLGDLDKPLQKNHGYTKLMKLHKEHK